MRKLALKDELLMQVEKPARYIGNEVNAVMKDKDTIDVRFAMCFPDVYEIGMSHLGIQILYDMFNRFEDVWCERVYSPWVDLDLVRVLYQFYAFDREQYSAFMNNLDDYRVSIIDMIDFIYQQKEKGGI